MKIVFKLFLVAILVGGAGVAGFVARRICWPLSGVRVTVNGVLKSGISAQTCPDGKYRVLIPGETQVLLRNDMSSGFYPGTQFFEVLGVTLTPDLETAGVGMHSPKIELDPDLRFTADSIEYTDFQSYDRIRITVAR